MIVAEKIQQDRCIRVKNHVLVISDHCHDISAQTNVISVDLRECF